VFVQSYKYCLCSYCGYTVKPVQTEPPSDRADRSVFRGVRFSQCWVFSAMCLSIHAYIFTFTRKCTSNKGLLTFTPQIAKNGPVPNKIQLTFFPIENDCLVFRGYFIEKITKLDQKAIRYSVLTGYGLFRVF